MTVATILAILNVVLPVLIQIAQLLQQHPAATRAEQGMAHDLTVVLTQAHSVARTIPYPSPPGGSTP